MFTRRRVVSLGPEQVQLLLQVARRYYQDGAHQGEIASEIHASRATVSRLLAQARSEGIVQIRIDHPLERTTELEQQLSEAYGLKLAFLCHPEPDEDLLSALGRRGSEAVAALVGRDSVVGISNGTTLAGMVAAMDAQRRRDSCVVQMIGSLGQETQLTDSPDLCRRMAEKLGGTYRVMPVPLIVRTGRLATAMRREQSVATTLALGSRPDIAFLGIGRTDATGSGHIFDGWMTPEIVHRLVADGAVGHLLGHHFDSAGRHIESPLCTRTVGVPLDRLTEIDTVVGVAGGPEKVEAIQGALAGGLVNCLVTDARAAEALLEAKARH
jgi:DNA-binding transcriptional regulator LsrR (DeoR family)